jgi:tRNA threonylcarbamoyladenosine biosynthesis protein TsaE
MESFLKKNFTVMYVVKSASKQATIKAAKEFAGVLRPGDRIALCGSLGAGKTHFVKGLVAGRGGNANDVQSPTFNLIKQYSAADGIIYHFDLYRLRGFEELENTGYREIISDPEAIAAVEWPEIAEQIWTDFNFAVRLEHRGGNERRLTMYSLKIKAKAAAKKPSEKKDKRTAL